MLSVLLRLELLLILAASSAMTFAADVDNPEHVESFFDGMITPLMGAHNSASGVLIVAKGDRILFAKGYGYQDRANRIPVNPETTLFRPGSISKLFTWVAVMQQVERGNLNLDADVNEYLETFQIEEAHGRPVTLRHLLTHTAGFEDASLGFLIGVDEEKMLSLADTMRIHQPARINPPGVQTAYSNYGTALSALIVSNVSGLDYPEYVQKNVFDVLQMHDSTFEQPLPERYAGQDAKGYQFENGRYTEQPIELLGGFTSAGGLFSSGVDMGKFALAILNNGAYEGGRILQPETLATTLSRAFAHDDRMMGMALGFIETEQNGIRLVGHGGDMANFHSDLAIDQENGLAIYVSFAGDGGALVRWAIVPAFYDEFFPSSEPPPVPPGDFADRADKYTGTYLFWRRNFTLIDKFLWMTSAITISATENDELLFSFRNGSKRYVEIDKHLFREADSDVSIFPGLPQRLLSFQEDTNGEITGATIDPWPFMSMQKVPLIMRPALSLALLGFSLTVFLAVLCRAFFQRRLDRRMTDKERSAKMAEVYVASSNLLFFGAALLVLSVYGNTLAWSIPFAFKAMLVLPVIASLAGLHLLYRTIRVWNTGLLNGIAARIRHSAVTVLAAFMIWFYWYWNIIGFQYAG
ncbi:MAG: beta-lactamase family protein [Proteobacteria bacterium]|nr:beta-lactamase family protein [Pseudomonadota bacterium]